MGEEESLGATEDVLKANELYARGFELGHLPTPPARRLAVVACMDARLVVESILGLKAGDAHIIRNAGGLVTNDTLRSLLISHHLLGTVEFIIMNHTDCGLLTFQDEELKAKLERDTGTSAEAPASFHTFTDLDENVRQQVAKVRSHPWIPEAVAVRGFVYDVKSGRLREVH